MSITKLNCILLVDDDSTTNWLNRRIIEQSGCTENIEVVFNGKDALAFLDNCIDKKQQLPELIFLDINMPCMCGWEFVEKLSVIAGKRINDTHIVMLTASANPDDAKRANDNPYIYAFCRKPLTSIHLEALLKRL